VAGSLFRACGDRAGVAWSRRFVIVFGAWQGAVSRYQSNAFYRLDDSALRSAGALV